MRRYTTILIVFIALLLNIQTSYAGGLALYEIGARNVGLAGSGWAARGFDASTLFMNPAAMSLFKHSQLMLGAQVLYGQFGFNSNPATTVEGNDGGNPVGTFPGGGLFYIHKTSEKVTLGIGVFSYFGLSQKYDEGWVGRYYIQEGTLIGLTIMPSISYRVSEVVSLGFGLNIMYGIFDQKVAINNLGQQPDGMLAIDDETWGVGANVGVLFEFTPQTRVGIDYLSQVSLDFQGKSQFTGLGPVLEGILDLAGLLNSPLDVDIKVPHMVMASVYHEIDDNFAIMGNVGWQNWKSFGMIDITISANEPTSLTTDLKFNDTWNIAGGVEIGVAEKWKLITGFAFDSSPVEDEDRTLAFAFGQSIRYGIGTRWDVSDQINLGFSYEFVHIGNLPVDQFRGPRAGRVSGVYSNTAMHFFALDMQWALM